MRSSATVAERILSFRVQRQRSVSTSSVRISTRLRLCCRRAGIRLRRTGDVLLQARQLPLRVVFCCCSPALSSTEATTMSVGKLLIRLIKLHWTRSPWADMGSLMRTIQAMRAPAEPTGRRYSSIRKALTVSSTRLCS